MLTALENMKTTPAIDQVEEAARVDTDVVAAHACFALWHRRHERGHLARGMGICDVDDPKPVNKLCHRNFRPPHVRAGLMAAGERRLRRTIDTGHLETCNRRQRAQWLRWGNGGSQGVHRIGWSGAGV
jgi:hypothetical protein